MIKLPEEFKADDVIQVIAMDTIIGGRDEFTLALNKVPIKKIILVGFLILSLVLKISP